MIIDIGALPPPQRYQWMTQAIIPRPVAWTLTQNDNGDYNLAPFSYFNALASAPALIGASFGIKDDGDNKDTLANIRRRAHFVAHIAAMPQLPALNATAAALPYGESEISRANLRTAPFTADFPLPRVADAPIALACRRHSIIPLGKTQNLVIGELLYLYADDSVMSQDAKSRPVIDAAKTNPIARLSAGQYAGIANITTLPRP